MGKTSISSSFIYNEFNANETSSTTASFFTKQLEFDKNNTIRFNIWDTAGQEVYRSLTKIFYKNTNVAILIYDITDMKSFEEIKNYWYKQIKENSPKANKFLF